MNDAFQQFGWHKNCFAFGLHLSYGFGFRSYAWSQCWKPQPNNNPVSGIVQSEVFT